MIAAITTVAWLVSLAAFAFFIGLYHWMTCGTWRYAPMGRWLMASKSVIVAILLLWLARVAFGDYPGRQLLGMIGSLCFTAVAIWLNIALFKEQHMRGEGMSTYRAGLSSWARKPVAWLTTIVAVLGAATTLAQTPPFSEVVPDRWAATLAGVTTFAVVLLGAITHRKVTPIVMPRAKDGTPLVPAPAVSTPGREGDSRRPRGYTGP